MKKVCTEDLPPQTQGDPSQAAELRIAMETTPNEQTQTGQRPNKYLYPIFDGFSGERYLDTIIQQILPNALSRTWRYAVDFQAPGNSCYVGAARISQRVKPGTRKIEMDLHELEMRGLMRKYAARQPLLQEDGTFVQRAVVVKDFTSLYDLAYEYHLWTLSPEYMPPERDYIDLIVADPQLYQKLIRFDNYRRFLCCEKPGRKPQTEPLSDQCQFPTNQAVPPPPAQPDRTKDLSAKNYCNTPANSSSPYRRSKKEESVPENNSISTKGLEAMAIRKEPAVQQPETEEIVQSTENLNSTAEKQEEETKNEESKSKPVETPQKEEITPEAAKEEKEYNIEDLKQNPIAMTAFLLDLHAQQLQSEQQTSKPRSRKQKSQRKRRGTPDRIATTMAYIAQTLGGNPKFQQSDVTRLTKLYWAATQIFNGFTNAWFLDMIQEAFLTVCNTRGVKRRVPYFFKCLEDKLELTPDELVFIRSQEPLYADGDIQNFKASLRKAYEKSGTHLEYLEWIQQTYSV